MEQKDRILEGLKQAIQGEGDGYNFYTMASMNTEDEKGREVFQTLAQEEKSHIAFLKGQYKSIKEQGKVDGALKLPKQHEFTGDHPIFSPELKSRIKDAHMEMSALSIGIQLELSAIKFYEGEHDEAKRQNAPDVADFYQMLVDWEKGHYDALLGEQDNLKEDYWAAGGFAPF